MTPDAELAAYQRQIADLNAELEQTNRGLIALYAELEEARQAAERLAATEAELAAVRAEHELLAERDRMARDLHDRVIQRIFAAGMTLQTAAKLARSPQASARIEAVIGDLDTSIDEIRETIFELRHRQRAVPPSIRAGIFAVVAETEPNLGFAPALTFDGLVDSVPDHLSGHLLAVLREALSNVVRHAEASSVSVTIRVGPELELTVTDDGRGMGSVTRSSGVRNMRERAEELGGTFRLVSEPGAGTTLAWCVPAG